MKILIDGPNHIIRLLQNNEFIHEIISYCQSNDINAGFFSAIGAAKSVTVSFYNLNTKKYQDKTFDEDVEIVTVTGNIATFQGQIRIHAHGSFSRNDYSVFGGHVQNLVVSATCEIHLTKLDGRIKRELDEKTGLFLLKKTNSEVLSRK